MGSGRRPSPTTLVFLVLLYLFYAPGWAFSLSFNLNFSDPGAGAGSSITISGNALISSLWLELTKNISQSNNQYSVGRAWYKQKVPLWSSATGEMASFTTTFSFRIRPDKDRMPLTGDGMAFFLGHFPSPIPPKSYGGSLGLLPAGTKGTGDTRIVAVEFDTFRNTLQDSTYYTDINGNHIGIDINSLYSTESTDTTTSPGKNLTSGDTMTATINYHNDSKMLALDLLVDDALYQVSATVDISRYLPEEVAPDTVMVIQFHSTTSSIPNTNQQNTKQQKP